MKKKAVSILLISALVIASLAFLPACTHQDDPVRFAQATDAEDGYAYVEMNAKRDLKILQLTDIHLERWIIGEESFWHNIGIANNNASTLRMIDKLLEAVSPDLVILTGDMVRSWAYDNLEMYAQIADILEERGVVWMPIFGNHDCEYEFEDSQHSHAELASALAAYPHCLMSDASDAAVGEYFVNIKNKKGEIVYTLCCMGVYYDKSLWTDEFASGWSYLRTEEQLAWYETEIHRISGHKLQGKNTVVPSMVFTHCPVPEVLPAWEEAYNNGQPNEKYHYGNLLSGKSTYRKYLGQDGLFDKAIEIGSTKAMFFGHHHDNDFSVEYNGIRLTAGQMTTNNMDYRIDVTQNEFFLPTEIDFSRLYEYGDNRGGTLITITKEGDFTVQQALAREVIADYSDWRTDYDVVISELENNGIVTKR